MESSNDTVSNNLRIFQIFARHDLLIVFCALGGAYLENLTLGLVITAIPFLEFLRAFNTTKSIPEDLKAKIRNQFPSTRRVIFRNSGNKASQAFSLPFLKMIFLSQEHIDAYQDGRDFNINYVKAILAHEIGHLTQFDRLIIRWLQAIILIYGLATLIALYIDIIVPLSISWRFIYSPDVVRLLIMMSGFGFILFSLFHRIAHRREYIADLYALQTDKKIFLNFLHFCERTERKNKHKKKRGNKRNDWTHPSFYNRLKIVKSDVSVKHLYPIQIAFQWFVLFFLFDFFHGGQQPYSLFYFSTSILFLFLLISTLINLSAVNTTRKSTNKIIQNYGIGLALGFVFSYGYLWLIDHLSQINLWESKFLSLKFDVMTNTIFLVFIASAYAALFAFNILRKRFSISSSIYTPIATTVIFLAFFISNIDVRGTKKVITEYIAKQWPTDTIEALANCEKNYDTFNDESKLECLQLNKNKLSHELEVLKEQAVDKLKRENYDTFPSYTFKPFEPTDPKPKISAYDEIRVQRLKSYIKKWEDVEGQNFLEHHPSLKTVDIPNDAIVIQALPSLSRPTHEFDLNDPTIISIYHIEGTFDRTIWSSLDGICWYKKPNMPQPKKAYCGQAYQTWITDLYNAKTNHGELAPYRYIKKMEYDLVKVEKERKYTEDLHIYQRDLEKYQAYEKKKNELVDEEIKDEKQAILSELQKIELAIQAIQADN